VAHALLGTAHAGRIDARAPHVADPLGQAVFQIEHVRLGDPAPSEEAS